ncbi:hypothetical protein [Paenibacillus durus]|uniref:Uncharacterized protein n=1 Tax=Paenibacillus durus ATCC 35681 TaxID=1333534 RepID=A0A0F7CGV0_PAEDU|nr:hypothetical protein [Paenibacillus durus]AKG33270.1 hypothetical protein VK70_00455 [Paenibacillus durus ATCC 35681]
MSRMEYYVLEHDRRLPANGANLAFPERMLRGYGHAEQQEVVYVKPGNSLTSSSLIEHPILLVSEELRAIINKQIPEIAYKSVIVMDLKQQGQFDYAWMDFPEIPCIAPDRTGSENGQVMTIGVDPEALREAAIFQIPYYRSRVLVARVDVAESLLRKSLYGLRIRPIRLTGGEA